MNTAPNIPTLPTPSFAAGFTPAAEVGPPKSFLMYGKTGTRKTSMVGELVKEGFYKRALYIDLDNGSEVLSNDPAVKAAIDDGRIVLYPIDPFATNARMLIEGAILEMLGMYRTPTGSIEPNPNIPDFGFDLLIIDTVNLMHEIGLKNFQATTYSEKNPAKLDGQGAYAKIGVWDDEMLRLIHNSKRFTGAFLMHSKEVNEDTGATRVLPKLSGAFQNSISAIPSITAYLQYEKSPDSNATVLTATVGESATVDAKNRYTLPEKIFDFNLSRLFATIPNNRVAPATQATPAYAAPAAPPVAPPVAVPAYEVPIAPLTPPSTFPAAPTPVAA